MSRLTTSRINTGLLPVVYIDKVYISSELDNNIRVDTSDGLRLDVSIELSSLDTLEPSDDYISHLEKLYAYAVLIFKDSAMTEIKLNPSSIFDHMKYCLSWLPTSEDEAIWVGPIETTTTTDDDGVETTSNTYSDGIWLHSNYIKISFQEFFETGEDGLKYNEILDAGDGSGNLVYRYSTTIDVPLEQTAATSWTFAELYNNIVETTTDYTNLEVCTFSSIIDLQDEADTTMENELLVEGCFSEIAYERVFENTGEIAYGPHTTFQTNETSSPYSGVAMMTLDGTYHVADPETRESTYNNFYELIEEQTFANSSDDPDYVSTFEESINSLKQILEEEVNETTLITSLNTYRAAFPDKDNTTPAGLFYESLKTKVYMENLSYQNDLSLTKVLTFNNKIVDARVSDLAASDYNYPETETIADATGGEVTNNRIYDNALITRYAYNQSLAAGSAGAAETWEASDTLFTSGYIFFDTERAIRNDTVLSSLYDIDKLELYYGMSLTSMSLKITQSYLTRYYDEDVMMFIYTGYDSESLTTADVEGADYGVEDPLYPMQIVPVYSDIDAFGTPVYTSIDVGVDGTEDHTYCIIRNFTTPTIDTSNQGETNYRLTCFQFQDYYSLQFADESDIIETSQEHYGFFLTCRDNSLEVLNAIMGSYQTAMSEFEEYYNLASEFCAYNNINGYFNKFFVDGINELYSDDLENTPFHRAALIYNIHQDILYDFFGGDTEKLLAASSVLSAQLAPETGSMEQIESFWNSMVTLWESFYDTTGIFGRYIGAAEDQVAIGGDFFNYYNEFKDLPNIIDMGESYEDYSTEYEAWWLETMETAMAQITEEYWEYGESILVAMRAAIQDEYDYINDPDSPSTCAACLDRVREAIGDAKDALSGLDTTYNAKVEAAGITSDVPGYIKFPYIYPSVWKDMLGYKMGTDWLGELYELVDDLLYDLGDEAVGDDVDYEATENFNYFFELGSPYDVYVLRLFRAGD